ncbi:hypothetical protein JD844_002062, partial [Phrynosoma platyrhinos]
AEEIAISWPRITAFTETRGRRGLAPGLEMEPEQGQLAPLPGQAAAATAGSSEEGILPDFRRQLGVILQTVGKAQVEKMLRELVKEQEQQGRVRRRKRMTRSPRHGAGDGTVGTNNLEMPRESQAELMEGPAIPSRKPTTNELQVPLLCPGLVAGQRQSISGKMVHGDASGCKNSLAHQQSLLGTRWGAGLQPRESIGCSPLHNMSRDSQESGRVWPPFGERTQFFSGWQKPRCTQRRRRQPAGEKPHRCGPCRRTIVVPPARSSSPMNSALASSLDSASSLALPLNSIGSVGTQALSGNPMLGQHRKPHACEECGKRFRILANLERHQQRHVAEKPHQCHDCERRFRWGCHLERHRRSRRCEASQMGSNEAFSQLKLQRNRRFPLEAAKPCPFTRSVTKLPLHDLEKSQRAEDCLMLWKLTRVGDVGMDMALATRARMECLSCHRCHLFRTAERT